MNKIPKIFIVFCLAFIAFQFFSAMMFLVVGEAQAQDVRDFKLAVPINNETNLGSILDTKCGEEGNEYP